MLTISWDTETTGLDHYHITRPFFVTMCIDDSTQDDWEIKYWEWPVNPKTRMPTIPAEDVYEIRELLNSADRLVGQNMKFDVTALESIGAYIGRKDIKPLEGVQDSFPWEKCEDTLIAGHMLHTSAKHDLTSMVRQYLNDDPSSPNDIEPLERHIKECCERARRETRKTGFREVYGEWKIAAKGVEGMPSSKGKCWAADMWLPLALATECEYPPDHPFYSCLEEYSNGDSQYTLALWYKMEELIRRRGLWNIYRSLMETVPIGQQMERASVTGSITRAKTHRYNFETWRNIHIEKCTDIADEYGIKLKLPNSGTTEQLSDFVFKTLECPIVKRSNKTGEPSLDKDVLELYVKTVQQGHQLDFVTALQNKRKCDTAISYLQSYERFWIPTGDGCFRMHPFLNQTGTVQLRWSSSNPNETNISKQEGYNLRYAFGPDPDREWWSLDYSNLELRIPTFESGEKELMEVFLRPKDPPYYGSYHLVVFALLHPDKFKEHGKDCKDVYEATEYQWTKNGDFSFIYGAGKRKIDATFRVKGAFDMIGNRFPRILALAQKQLSDARKYGYVQTIPDKTVDPLRGFPIMASRTDNGDVLPTTPLNYHVSGTACWATRKAMIRCDRRLQSWAEEGVWCGWNRVKKTPIFVEPAHTKMQIHDELVFDFPKSKVSPKVDLDMEKENGGPITYTSKENSHIIDVDRYKSNLGFVRELQREMERSGTDLGMPLPVGVELNADNWGEITLKC